MKRKPGNLFRWLYWIVLLVFLTTGAALAVQIEMLHNAEGFYRQIGAAGSKPAGQHLPHEPSDTSATSDHAADSPDKQRTEELSRWYPGAAAWIRIPDTSLDYPVMQGIDNQYYLDHLPDGSSNVLGSLFLDYRCSVDSAHLVIYGHNGSGGRMLGLLKNYASQDYYRKHPDVILAFADVQYVCHIFSVRRVEADSSAYTLDLEDSAARKRYIRQAAAASIYPILDLEESCDGKERILTMSTCTGWGNQRLLVQALLQER